jgi:hypothetical protein
VRNRDGEKREGQPTGQAYEQSGGPMFNHGFSPLRDRGSGKRFDVSFLPASDIRFAVAILKNA